MVTMPGWVSRAQARASRSSRSTACASAFPGVRVLTATVRSSTVSYAL